MARTPSWWVSGPRPGTRPGSVPHLTHSVRPVPGWVRDALGSPAGKSDPTPHLQGFPIRWKGHGHDYHLIDGVLTGRGGDSEARLPWEGQGEGGKGA